MNQVNRIYLQVRRQQERCQWLAAMFALAPNQRAVTTKAVILQS